MFKNGRDADHSSDMRWGVSKKEFTGERRFGDVVAQNVFERFMHGEARGDAFGIDFIQLLGIGEDGFDAF